MRPIRPVPADETPYMQNEEANYRMVVALNSIAKSLQILADERLWKEPRLQVLLSERPGMTEVPK